MQDNRTPAQLIADAVYHLRMSRESAKLGQWPNLVRAINHALASADGARRNQQHRDDNPTRRVILAAKGDRMRARQNAVRERLARADYTAREITERLFHGQA